MKVLDTKAINVFGIPSLLLMENAGRGIAELAAKMANSKKRILIVVGKGNNGGDGLSAARHLYNRGYQVDTLLLTDPSEFKNDPKVNYEILKKMKPSIHIVTSSSQLSSIHLLTEQTDLIVDAIFGIGLARPVSGLYADVIENINAAQKPVLAIDIPSGLHSDTGEVMGCAVRAAQTGTLACAKVGLLKNEGPKFAGTVTVLDISIPKELLEN